MSYKKELIDIYASTDLSTVGNVNSYQNLVADYNQLSAFNHFRDKIAQYKGWIEKTVYIQSSEKNQVVLSLTLVGKVLREKDDELFKSCVELIEKACVRKLGWSNNQVQYFTKTSLQLKKTRFDYFLSFTQRNRSPMTVKKVNSDYMLFVKRILGIKQPEFRTEGAKRNLLAQTIHHLLTEEGLKGFYFPDREENTEKVLPKLQEALDSHFIFVQIIQNVIFDEPNSDNNICFYEYDSVKKKGFADIRIKFINAEGSRDKLPESVEIHPDYTEWHEEILEEDAIILEFPESGNDVKLLKDKISDNLSSLLKEYKKKLIEDVPWN